MLIAFKAQADKLVPNINNINELRWTRVARARKLALSVLTNNELHRKRNKQW